MNIPPVSPSSRRSFLRHLALGTAGLALGGRAFATGPAAPVAPGRKLGVALVGLGSYATHQLAPALLESKYCRLAGIVTGTPEKAARWTRDYALPDHCVYDYGTMDRLADNPAIDIVYVVTPPGLHAEHTIRAAKAGKHVICEKPMAVSVAECEAMIGACRAAGVHLSIGYRLQYHPMWQELKRLAREKEYGEFKTMGGGFGFHHRGGGWRLEMKLAGGGPLMDLGIYVIQAACMAGGGAPIAVTASEPPKNRPAVFKEVEETINFTLEFANGATCEGMCSYETGANHFRAEAPQGAFAIEPAFSYNGLVGRTSAGLLPSSTAHQQAAQIDGIAEAILAGTPSLVPGEMGRRDMQIVTAIYEASRTGRRVLL
ncbi:MAG: Gfo/Idh/MocA family oxidoreductase [Opitutaceae bacterium]|nr:Gfo/Idh/MocA family oxidoreductase [Opitutaceae bacterium]